MKATDTFRCDRFACALTKGACIRRQLSEFRLPAKRGTKVVHAYCASGECDQGKAILSSVEDPPEIKLYSYPGQPRFYGPHKKILTPFL